MENVIRNIKEIENPKQRLDTPDIVITMKHLKAAFESSHVSLDEYEREKYDYLYRNFREKTDGFSVEPKVQMKKKRVTLA